MGESASTRGRASTPCSGRSWASSPPWEGSPRTRLGQELEDYTYDLWRDEEWRTSSTQHPPGWRGRLMRSADRDWQLATPDVMLDSNEPVELKTWDDHDRAAWEDWEDGVPARVRAQVLWQMDTLDVQIGYVGVLFLPSGEFESRTIEHGDGCTYPETCTCSICFDIWYERRAGEAFWARVREGFPPFPDGSPATLAAVKALHAGICAGSAEIAAGALHQWLDKKLRLADMQGQLREAEAALRIELGDAETGTVGGEPVIKRTRYDVAAKVIERKAYTVDKLTRLGARNGDGDE